MTIVFIAFTLLTAILHCLFFKLESIDFMKTKVLRRFGLSEEQGAVVKVWAFNQGFYNLFLSLGLFYSIYLHHSGSTEQGILLARFILLTIVGAGMVLFVSAPKKYVAALVQAIPALFALIASFFSK
jgi:putative membrane protein